MIKALSLAAALALLPLSASVAQEVRGSSEEALEAAAEAFEARMESFGDRAEVIAAEPGLTKAQRELRIAALWSEYQPDVDAFTATVTEHASGIAAEALAEINVEAIVAEALADVDLGAVTAEAFADLDASGVMAGAQGMAANGSWASNDPEHMATYGLVAEYALGEALDAVDEAEVEIEADVAAETEAGQD